MQNLVRIPRKVYEQSRTEEQNKGHQACTKESEYQNAEAGCQFGIYLRRYPSTVSFLAVFAELI